MRFAPPAVAMLSVAIVMQVATAAAQIPSPPTVEVPSPPTAAAGVSALGVDLAGQSQEQVEATLQSAIAPHLERSLVVRVGGKRHVLSTRQAELTFDALTTAKRAVRAKSPGEVKLALTFSAQAVRTWVERVAARRDRAPRDAKVRIAMSKIGIQRGRDGVVVPQDELVKQLTSALTTPGSSNQIAVKMRRAAPTVDVAKLKQMNGTIITVDKSTYKLRLFKRLKLAKTYGVSLGMPGNETPSGSYRIQNKQVNPVWSAPNSPWAGELGGTTVAAGSPQNPLRARWMGIVGPIGIHGTGAEGSIGQRASHGCIRMRVSDVIALYERVPVGTPIVIG